jgi:hypothetical protein
VDHALEMVKNIGNLYKAVQDQQLRLGTFSNTVELLSNKLDSNAKIISCHSKEEVKDLTDDIMSSLQLQSGPEQPIQIIL